MELVNVLNKIGELMSHFVTQIKSATALGQGDLNKAAETVLLPLFAEICGYQDLKNLNYSEELNFPAIDLADRVKKVAFQITATPTNEKVKHTLRKFVEHNLYDKYDRLIIYILTEKKSSYSTYGYKAILKDKLAFNPDRDIWDYTDVLRQVSGFELERAQRVLAILKAHFPSMETLLKELNRPLLDETNPALNKEIYQNYLKWIAGRNRYLEPRGTPTTLLQVKLPLSKIYLPLAASPFFTPQDHPPAVYHGGQNLSGLAERAGAPSSEKPEKPVSLAQLVRTEPHLVILSDPGGGKSTFLRYLALQHAEALLVPGQEAVGAGDQHLPGELAGPALLPIFVRIAEYVEASRANPLSLTRYLARYCIDHEFDNTAEPELARLFQVKLSEGSCLILLDGLDEVVNAADRRMAVARVEEFISRYSSVPDQGQLESSRPELLFNHFIITSRIAGYSENTLKLSLAPSLGRPEPARRTYVYGINGLNYDQIRAYLERWCPAVEVQLAAVEAPPQDGTQTSQTAPSLEESQERRAQSEIRSILEAVRTNAGVARLAANPLLLRLIALIHRQTGHLPHHRVTLYQVATTLLGQQWRLDQGVNLPPAIAKLLTDQLLIRRLGRLAYWLHSERPSGVASQEEIINLWGEDWARAYPNFVWDRENPPLQEVGELQDFLAAVVEHAGLLVENEAGKFKFSHLTFEEYYAARYLVARASQRVKLIRRHLLDPRWREPIRLALSYLALTNSGQDAADVLETAVLPLTAVDKWQSPYLRFDKISH
jgi:hypothetical protein